MHHEEISKNCMESEEAVTKKLSPRAKPGPVVQDTAIRKKEQKQTKNKTKTTVLYNCNQHDDENW